MKKLFKTLIPAAILLLAASCVQESDPDFPDSGVVIKEFKATFEQGTKTALSGTGNTRKVTWCEGDIVRYYSQDNGTVGNYTIPEDCESATLKLQIEGKNFINAAYGAKRVVSPSRYSMSLGGVIPPVQYGQFGSVHASVAHLDNTYDEVLVFKNIVGLVRFTLPSSNIHHIIFSGNNNEVVNGSGWVAVTFDEVTGEPSVTADGDIGTDITVVTEGKAGEFYLALIPQTFSNGFTIRFFDENNMRIGNTRSDNPLVVTRSKIVNLGDLVSHKVDEPYLLNSAATANCYIVSEKNQEFRFNATVKGNSTSSTDAISPATAVVLWESRGKANGVSISKGSVVKNVVYQDGYVYFSSGDQGNALIAVRDKAGDILWSWHIWVWPGYNETDNSVTYKNNAGVSMDRDLGASALISAGKTTDHRAYGLRYQWGRKDPFFSTDFMVRAGEGFSNASCSGATGSVEWATKNPLTYITYVAGSNGDWISGTAQNGLWSSTKTMYDPCPAGWKVPDKNFYYNALGYVDDRTYTETSVLPTNTLFRLELGGIISSTSSVPFTISGMFDGTSSKSPASGGLEYDSVQGDWWTNTANTSTNGGYMFNIRNSGRVVTRASGSKTRGQSVRCVKDGTPTNNTGDSSGSGSGSGSGGGGGDIIADVPVTGISINPNTLSLNQGETYQLEAVIVPDDASNKTVVWTTTDEDVVTVSSTGLVEAIGKGEAFIYVSSEAYPSITNYCYVNVSGNVVPSGKDLSAKGTSNCYIVSESGRYRFLANVKGNSNKPLSPQSAKILWQTYGTNTYNWANPVVAEVSLEGDYICFTVPADMKNGNAVIAACGGDGEIIWSWHIWACSGFNPESTAHNYFNEAGTVMDRNIGATSAEQCSVGALGLLYQWGRKDPFPSSSRADAYQVVTIASDKSISFVSSSSSTGTMDYAIANPLTFISGSADWMSKSVDTLWRDDHKTMYDPCPVGWRLPAGGDNGLWATACGTSTGVTASPVGSYGVNWQNQLASGNVWYPYSGYMYMHSSGLLTWNTGGSTPYWAGTAAAGTGKGYCLTINGMAQQFVSGSVKRYEACPIRCIKE